MSTRTEAMFVGVGAGVFALSLLLSLSRLASPNYGGDEVWFATPLVARPLGSLELFQFEYAGPLKTILTYPIFATFGFDIVPLRLFTLSAFAITAATWALYLARNGLLVAAAATSMFLALHPDLQFFSRDDINQPTVHNLVVVMHLVTFLSLATRGPRAWIVASFLLLSFVDVNDHIRNVWLCNAFMLAFVVDHAWQYGVSKAGIIKLAARGWPILVGWVIGVTEFVYVLVHFAGSPGLEGARALGAGYTWTARVQEVARSLPQLISGETVLSMGYQTQGTIAIVLGVLLLIITAYGMSSILRQPAGSDLGARILRLSAVVWVAIIGQYIATKSARWPWHGNSVQLLWAITFGLVVQALWTHDRRRTAVAYAGVVFGVFVVNRFELERAVSASTANHTGFELAVWNPQGLDAVRAYVRRHSGDYVFADWAVGRPLALELRYRPQPRTTGVLYDSGISDDAIRNLGRQQVILRAVGAAVTVPDMSDARLARLDRRFAPFIRFRDDVGREVYELGYLVRLR